MSDTQSESIEAKSVKRIGTIVDFLSASSSCMSFVISAVESEGPGSPSLPLICPQSPFCPLLESACLHSLTVLFPCSDKRIAFVVWPLLAPSSPMVLWCHKNYVSLRDSRNISMLRSAEFSYFQ